jgi:hypothetical protein
VWVVNHISLGTVETAKIPHAHVALFVLFNLGRNTYGFPVEGVATVPTAASGIPHNVVRPIVWNLYFTSRTYTGGGVLYLGHGKL